MKFLTANISVVFSLWVGVAHAASDGDGSGGIPGKALVYAFLNVIFLLVILVLVLRKPAKDFFASRAALIRKDLEESKALKDAALAKHQEFEERLQVIREEMQAMIEELRKDGQLERERIIQEAKEQVESLTETSKRIMGQEVRKAKEVLKIETVQLAAEMAEALVRQNITADDQKRIVDQYIVKMGDLS